MDENMKYAEVELLAGVAARQGNPQFALGMLKALTVMHPDHEDDALCKMANIYLGVGQLKEAEDALNSALKANPDNKNVGAIYGKLYTMKNNPKVAIDCRNMTAEADPPDLVNLYELMKCYRQEGQVEKADTIWHQILWSKSQPHRALFALGFELSATGDYPEAEKVFKEAIAAKENFSAAWYELANVLRQQGKTVESEKAMQNALKWDPDIKENLEGVIIDIMEGKN